MRTKKRPPPVQYEYMQGGWRYVLNEIVFAQGEYLATEMGSKQLTGSQIDKSIRVKGWLNAMLEAIRDKLMAVVQQNEHHISIVMVTLLWL